MNEYMLNNQQYLKTIAVFTLIAALAISGVSATAFADSHTDADVEIDGEGEEDIRYSTIVGLYGEPFDDSSNTYLIEAANLNEYDESTLEEVTLNGDVVPGSAIPAEELDVGEGELGVRVDTSVYDQYVLPGMGDRLVDPQGQYVLREPIQNANVDATDQHPEAPAGIDVALDSFAVDANEAITATSDTNANQVQDTDYMWAVELGPTESDVVEDGSGSYVSSDALVLLDESNYNDINYEGLDGVYDLENSGTGGYYPGTLSYTAADLSSDIIERPTEGQLELDRGVSDIPVSTELSVEYTDVNNPVVDGESPRDGPISEGEQITLSNDFIQVDPSFVDSRSFDDTSLEISVLSDRQVEADYEIAASGANKVDVAATAPGETPGTATGDETAEWEVVSQNRIRTSNNEVLLDTLNLIDSTGSLTTSDLEIVEANKGNGVEIVFPDLTGEDDVTSDRFELEYTYVDGSNNGGTTRQQVTDEELVPFGDSVTAGQTRSLDNSDIIVEVSESTVDFGETYNVRLNDQTLSTPDTIDLVSEGNVASTFDPTDPTSTIDEVEFGRDIDQNVAETFGEEVSGDTYLDGISPGQNPSITLGFDMTAQQTIDIAYTHYQDSTVGQTETVVEGGSNGELGPSGEYEIEDPRADRFATMALSSASATDFGLSVVDRANFVVGIDEQDSFSSVAGGNVELSEYAYTLGSERIQFGGRTDSEVNVNNDGTSEFNYELQHDRSQVDYDISVELQTEDGPRSDSVTLTSEVPSGNSLSVGGADTFVVDALEMDTGIDYAVQLLHDGTVIGQEEVEAGQNQQNYLLELNPDENLGDYDGEDVTVRLMRYDQFDESTGEWVPVRNENLDTSDGDVTVGSVVEETVAIDSQDGQLAFPAESSGEQLDSPLSQDWNLLPQFQNGEKNDDDQRVFVNRLNTGEEPTGPVNIPVGSEVVVAGNEFDVGDTLTLRREDPADDVDQFSVDLTVEESDTVNENQLVINTTIPQIPDVENLEGRFEVLEPQSGDVVFNYGTTDQNLDAEIDPERVNLNTETTAELNISSDLTDYDVLISSEQFDAEELLELFPQDVQDEYQIEINAPDDEEDERVRLSGLDERPESITLELSGQSAQEYGLQISAVGSGASDTVTFETAFGSEGDANFADSVGLNDTQTFRVAQGDTARIGVQVEETNMATLSFTDNDYEVDDIQVQVDDDREDFVLLMDTYLADGERVNGEDVSFTDVFSVEGGEFVNTPSLPAVTENFETGLYPMNLEVEDRETDLATLVVEDRETREVNTWVMPRGEELDLQNLQEDAVQQSEIAMEDTMIIEMSMSGFDSPELITNETDPAKLVNPYRRAELDDEYDTAQEFVDQEVDGVDSVANASQINLEVEGEKPRNRPSPHLLLDQAEEIETIVGGEGDNRVFLFFDLTRTKFDNFNSNIDMLDNEDHLTDYELDLNFSESYKYVDDEDDTEADLTEEMGVNERTVNIEMPFESFNGEDTQTRWILQPEENSTVTGETFVAPGTELSVIVQDDFESTVQESPLTLEQEVTVQQEENATDNLVQADFDLSGVEAGREMTVQFFGINDRDPFPAIAGEPQVAPNITDITADLESEGAQVGDEVSFEATIEQVDPTAVSYEWDFGDGSDGSSVSSPTHVFEEAGNYNVSLTVTTEDGLEDTAETEVVVTEETRTAPEIIRLIAPNGQLQVGEAAEFAVVARDDQVSADELVYEWDFADGTTATGITASHTYGVPDTYEVQVTVSDPENPEELQTTESVLVEVVSGDGQQEENETDGFDLTVNAVDAEAGEALPNAQIEVQNGSTQQVVESGTTDGSGTYSVNLEGGNYIVQASASGYEDFSTGVELTGNDTIEVSMTPENTNGGDGNNSDSGENPDQPGFTLILAAVGLVAAGGYIVYRRRM